MISQEGAGPPPTWTRALQAHPRVAARAALIYLQLGAAWPPYVKFVTRAASFNREAIDFYFLGPNHTLAEPCANCIFLPLDEDALHHRIEHFLGLARGSVTLDRGGRKLCDMKPMWPALFPELTARHEFIGYSDHDILLGNLSAEVEALTSDDDMLTPMAWFPQPITNGNLLLVRTTPKMVNAFRRSPSWRAALRQPSIYVFDEHWGSSGPGMHHVYQDMLLGGELRVRPTRRMLVQDIVFLRGKRRKGLYPTIASFGARASISWHEGTLVAQRDGPCVCSAQVWDIDLGSCAECLTQPDRVHEGIRVRRRVEVVGFHFQVFKMHWRMRARDATALAEFVPANCPTPMAGFNVTQERGFQCASGRY